METFRIDDNGIFDRLKKISNPNFTRKMASDFGTIAVNFSKERFVKKDWHDQVHERWTPRKRKARGSLMVKSGRLKRSIKKIASGEAYVIIGTDVPYAKAHNEGGTIKKAVYVKAHTRKRNGRSGKPAKVTSHTRNINMKLPKRQFMGKSRALELRLMRHLRIEFTKRIQRNL